MRIHVNKTHLAQLTNAWQEMWANAANREIVNLFIDATKAVVEFIDAVGIVPATIGGALGYAEVLRTGKGEGVLSQLFSLLNARYSGGDDTNSPIGHTAKQLGDVATKLDETGQAWADYVGEALEAAEAVEEVGDSSETISGVPKKVEEIKEKFQKLKTTLKGISKDFLNLGKSIAAFVASNPLIGMASLAGVALGAVALGSVVKGNLDVRKRQEEKDEAISSSQNWESRNASLKSYISQYEELKQKLDSENLSEQETLQTKEQIYNIQKQIADQYGHQADGLDLVNGKLFDQLQLLQNISAEESAKEFRNNEEGYRAAIEDYAQERTVEIEFAGAPTEQLGEDIQKLFIKNGFNLGAISQGFSSEGEIGAFYNRVGASFKGNAKEAVDNIDPLITSLEHLQDLTDKDSGEYNYINSLITQLKEARKETQGIVTENESGALSGLRAKIEGGLYDTGSRSKSWGQDVYKDYMSSVSDLESAYISGDTKKIQEARSAYEEATKAKNEFLKVGNNGEFLTLFNSINTSLIDTKNRAYDATEAFKKASEINNELNRIDDYKEQKKQADEYYNSLNELQKVGNIDNGDRPFIFWDRKEAKKQQEALESWGESVKDIIGSYSTVYGGSGEFDGVEIAFTPIINDGTGKGKLLSKETLYNYIDSLINEAGEGWTNDKLLALDAEGMTVDGIQISNVIADIGDTAVETGEKMHDWQADSIGYVSDYRDEWEEAIETGESLDEHMQNREKELKDVSKATDNYTKEDKKLAKAIKEVISLDMDRVDAEMVFDENANASDAYSNALYNLMDALGWATDQQGSFIDWAVDVGLIQGDVTDATNSASDAYNQFSQEIATAIENVSKLNAVLTESVSGAGISTQNIDAFKEMFGDDYAYALERSANGYHINAEKLQTLIDKQDALTNSDYQKTLDAQYDALKRCNDEIVRANNEQQDTTGLLAQRQGILQRIQDTQDLMMAYQASTSAYQTWVNAQSNGNEYDMYDKIAGGYDTVKDLIDRGWGGDDTVRSYLDLIYGDSFDAFTASGEECVEMFDKLDDKIEGTSFSIRDFFQFDSSGKLTSGGIFNFFDALKEKQDELDLDDKSKWIKDDGTYDFGFGRDREAAEALGIDVEFFQSMLRAAVSAGFELNLDQPMWAMDELKDKASQAQEELGGFNDIDFDELYNNLDDEDAYETISGHIDDVYSFIQDVENSDLSPELKTQQIEQAQDMLSYLVALEREAADRGEIDLKATVVGSATDKISKLIDETEGLPDVLKEYNWDEITDKNGLQKARDFIAAEVEGGKIDSSSAESFLGILDQALYELGLIDSYEANPTFKGNTVEAYNEVAQAKADLEEYLSTVQKIEKEHPELKIDFSEDPEVQRILSILYGENTTPDIKAAFEIDEDGTPEQVYEMLEEGERDVDVLLKGDTAQLEKDLKRATTNSGNTTVKEEHVETNTKTEVTNKEEHVSTSLTVDDENFGQRMALNEQRLEHLDSSKAEVEILADSSDYDKKSAETESNAQKIGKTSATVTFKGDNSDVINKANTAYSTANVLNTTITTVFRSSGLGGLKDDIQDAVNKVNNLNSRISTVSNRRISGTVEINGTAHSQGTAFVKGSITSGNAFTSGNWGIPKDQTALVNEVGEEIIVRDGRWFIANGGNAGFTQLQKGDVVFNSEQSKELLEKGYVTGRKRASMVGFSGGTAFSSGSQNGATRPRVPTSSSSKSSSSSGSSSNRGGRNNSGNGGNGGNNGNHGNNNNNNNTDNKAKETKNTLDEVEILIARIERQISNLDKTIGKTYLSWTTRNKTIRTDLKKVSKEIQDQNQAYTTYKNKAASIDLPASWKQKIVNGKFKIEDVIEKAKENGDTSDSLWDKINQYKEWYEKMLAAKDAIADLTSKEADLYKQRFDNEQTYFENLIAQIEHSSSVASTLADTLEESGKLSSKVFVYKQLDNENAKLNRLNKEYENLVKRRDEAVKAGKIKKGSEMWYEMQESINSVCESIEEAEKNIVSYNNALRQVDWDRWDKIHDAIDGVNNELEFLYDLLDEDKMFDEQGNITNQGTTAFALLAQQYDTYARQVQEYQKEIDKIEKQLAKDPNNQNLVDKLKEVKEKQQDVAASFKKTEDSMVDVTENGIKKQIEYVKKLIDDYEDLLETQKDQTEYAKKVADQQKEINRLEKQYRAIQNDTSEEGATKRQKLRDQINEKRQSLQETQEDRRLSETKDMLSKFEENFEDFLNNKLNNVQKIVQDVITATNNNRDVISNTINEVSKAYGYTPSSTLQSAISDMSKNLVSYFNSQGKFTKSDVSTITEGVNAIIKYFTEAQSTSDSEATKELAQENNRHTGNTGVAVKGANGKTTIVGTNGKPKTGFYTQDGKTYYAKDGKKVNGSRWLTVNNKKYYLDSTGARVTGNKYINGRYYQFDKKGVLQKKSDKSVRAEVIKSSKTHMLARQDAKGNTVQGYYRSDGTLDTKHTGWTKKGDKIYRFENGKQVTSKWVTSDGKKYYVRKDGTRASGFVTINGKTYYFADNNWKGYKDKFAGQMLTGFKTIGKNKYYFGNNGVMTKNAWQTIAKKRYYFDANGRAVTGKQTINKEKYTFNNDGTFKKKGWKKGTASVPTTDLAWTNENHKAEAIIRKSDGAILTPLSKGDSVIPNNAMKNMYQALTDPAKYLKQYTMPDVKVVQSTGSSNSSPTINMQFIANGVQDANKFANELMNNKKLEKWIQEVTLGQANGNNSFKKYNFVIR